MRDVKKTDSVTFRCAPEVKTALEKLAVKDDRSLSYFINKILEEWISQQHPDLMEMEPIHFNDVREPDRLGAAESDGSIKIPVYTLAAAAGGGAFVIEEKVEREIEVVREWVAHELEVPAENLFATYVRGDSMFPDFRDNDMVIAAREEAEQLRSGRVYIFRMGEEIFLKRIRKVNGGLRATSENSDFKGFDISEGDFELIGRVVWNWRKV